MLVGPPAADGSSDTYVLYDGSDTFEPYDKRSSEDCVYSQAACTYRGRLFVIGASLLEPDNRLFRATAMEVPEYPGDIPCDVDPGPEPNPVPTPDPKLTPTNGTATTSTVKTLPQTGDETTPLLALLFAGVATVATGAMLRRLDRSLSI